MSENTLGVYLACRQIVEHGKVSLCSLIYFGLSVINLYNRRGAAIIEQLPSLHMLLM